MKKIIYILTATVSALMLAASCNLNDYPVFDDENAFVSFSSTAVSCQEDAGTVEVSVVLSSVAGIATTVTYELVDSTAVEGVNYIFDSENASLTFDAENRTQTIPITILNRAGDYTGDLVFKVVFSSTGSVTDGAANECIVTIQDLDHPLSSILGTYTATSAFGSTWSMTLSKDEEDESIVWFYDICNLGSWVGDDMMYYGVVDMEENTISIPLGQSSEYVYSNENPVLLVGMEDIPDMPGYINIYYDGNITVNISDNRNQLEFVDDIQYLGGYIKDADRKSVV